MSRPGSPASFVGNDFVIARPRLQTANPAVSTPIPVITVPAAPVVVTPAAPATRPVTVPQHAQWLPFLKHCSVQAYDVVQRYSLITFALLFLLVGSSGTLVAGSYGANRIEASAAAASNAAITPHHTIAGLNITVPHAQLQAKIQSIMSQPATFTIGSQSMQLNPERIKGWLQITTSKGGTEDSIHINPATINASMLQLANTFVKEPVNQVSISRPDGSSQLIASGHDGAKLADPASLTNQSREYAKTLLDARGIQFTTPLQTVPFQAVTQTAFAKLIEVNVVTKQMYLYDNGQLTHSYPISAGAPATPTPIGQYKIYSQLAVQDMKGTNPNGTPYLQPHVHWISYFLPGGYAIHGNYWRPSSWFGVINSSHGCVSLPDSQAKEVYDWANIGTTVITHS